jgi:hypothetical protein
LASDREAVEDASVRALLAWGEALVPTDTLAIYRS